MYWKMVGYCFLERIKLMSFKTLYPRRIISRDMELTTTCGIYTHLEILL